MVFFKAVHDGRNQRFAYEPRFVAHAVAGNVALQGFFFLVVQHERVRVCPVGCRGFRNLFPWFAHGFSIFICSNGAGNASAWNPFPALCVILKCRCRAGACRRQSGFPVGYIPGIFSAWRWPFPCPCRRRRKAPGAAAGWPLRASGRR